LQGGQNVCFNKSVTR